MQPSSPHPKNHWIWAETAAYLSLSKSHLYHLTSEGLIPHYKPNGKKIYFLKSDLDSYLLRNRRAGAADIETATQSHIAGSKTTVVGRVR